jgi:hypothetical protein
LTDKEGRTRPRKEKSVIGGGREGRKWRKKESIHSAPHRVAAVALPVCDAVGREGGREGGCEIE